MSVTTTPVIPDFDMLVSLHEHDPEAFEALRRHLLWDAVRAAPVEHQPSLERLLARIEATRASAGSPAQAANQAFEMMAESLKELRESWHQACHSLSELQARLLIERVR
ncbi:uncharacterized protein DUF3135 [Paucimonas lemoignei]|uniref:Uncharacterized protein DUF3135 n=1 Tax=Paucimonas lemoignei TaxID=29443 RepID=A0A4R3HT75_PAULE|nr:DUF3135 domain-containing protein [Paucimonas lemoignei]TCS34722.1 uncharacterized protein DUF3135 [Paucimonas lemoignei]